MQYVTKSDLCSGFGKNTPRQDYFDESIKPLMPENKIPNLKENKKIK